MVRQGEEHAAADLLIKERIEAVNQGKLLNKIFNNFRDGRQFVRLVIYGASFQTERPFSLLGEKKIVDCRTVFSRIVFFLNLDIVAHSNSGRKFHFFTLKTEFLLYEGIRYLKSYLTLYIPNLCFIKIRSKHSSNTLLCLLRIFMKQTLDNLGKIALVLKRTFNDSQRNNLNP